MIDAQGLRRATKGSRVGIAFTYWKSSQDQHLLTLTPWIVHRISTAAVSTIAFRGCFKHAPKQAFGHLIVSSGPLLATVFSGRTQVCAAPFVLYGTL